MPRKVTEDVLKKKRKDTLNKAYALAFEYEQKYGSCAQCVLAAIHDIFGIVDDEVFKSGHVLAGGVGLAGDGSCGALSGGSMALSCKYGRNRENFGHGSYLKSYKLAKKLHDRFIREYGSCICRDVQKKIFGKSFNLWNPNEYKDFESAGGHKDKCPDVAGKVAMWVAEILLEEEQSERE